MNHRCCSAARFLAAVALCCLALAPAARAEDGYDLWLRHRPTATDSQRADRALARTIVVAGGSKTLQIAGDELARGLEGVYGRAPDRAQDVRRGAILLGTPETSPEIARIGLETASLGKEGYLIRNVRIDGRPVTVVAGASEIGAMYGAFALLRHIGTGGALADVDIRSVPKVQLRVLNHWDNLDRTVERGYAGQSIWDWHTLPDYTPSRYAEYARANASIGINGAVLNNVNAKATSLTAPYIAKAAGLADVFRPYGIKVYLSARFSAPIEIGGLKTADPLDPQVRKWWRDKADEIYRQIPDFGGFLVKANSEGQPGPQDYKRSHADGANMLADALAPHGGVVMWRAFVYAHDNPDDRAKQAFNDFVPLDGTFRRNVIVQVKNGAIDFQPREPFHPMFGAMPKTPLMMEFQITKEYLGFSSHLAYLGPLYEEVLRARTARPTKDATVTDVIDGSAYSDGRLTGMAGVANIGSDRNWSGSHFDQANWYVFGRLAWDPDAKAEDIAREWTKLTFSNDERFVAPAVGMMMGSREAVVEYMTPLGLTHLMGTSHHYGPGPWVSELTRPEWNPVYYHKADASGIGFDRTAKGSNAVAQYAPEIAATFSDLKAISDKDLLWFHHVPWDYRMRSGRILWDELVLTYGRGVEKVGDMRRTWSTLSPYVDAERFEDISEHLSIQEKEAQWWRDSSVAYFQSISKRPLPDGAPPPPLPLSYYKALSFPFAPG